MTERAFLDANVFIHASGADGPHRLGASAVVLEMARSRQNVWSSAEVLQEVLNVYVRRGERSRAEEMVGSIDELLGDHVERMIRTDVIAASRLATSYVALQARDLIHVAVMRRLGISHIISADRGFDSIPNVTRLDPRDFLTWRETVFGG